MPSGRLPRCKPRPPTDVRAIMNALALALLSTLAAPEASETPETVRILAIELAADGPRRHHPHRARPARRHRGRAVLRRRRLSQTPTRRSRPGAALRGHGVAAIGRLRLHPGRRNPLRATRDLRRPPRLSAPSKSRFLSGSFATALGSPPLTRLCCPGFERHRAEKLRSGSWMSLAGTSRSEELQPTPKARERADPEGLRSGKGNKGRGADP